jgi:Tol biopolymer transport system component
VEKYSDVDFDYVWAITLSPDGSTLAFKAQRPSDPLRPSVQLLLLDLHTGNVQVLLESYPASAPLSWSPDGRFVVYEHPVRQLEPQKDRSQYEIRILDLRTRHQRTLVPGSDPAWSPLGEWIAYLNDAGELAIVHPDGTDRTALVSVRRSFPWFYKRYFVYPPVWSPDSKALLLNETALDETDRTMIHQFDLGPRKLQNKQGKGVSVLGWSRTRARFCQR